MKQIMCLFDEKPASIWMKYYMKLIHPFSKFDTIVEQHRDKGITEYNLCIKLSSKGYILSEGLWKSKKTLRDYLSYLNQHSYKEAPITVYIYNTSPYGDYNFINNMSSIKSSFKRIIFKGFMIKDDKNDWIDISNLIN